MTESEHTPTPWYYTVADTPPEYGATILGRGHAEIGWPVVADLPPRTENGTHEGNAALIVKAVNSHADLLDALRECEDYFDNRADADCDQDGYIPNEEMKLLQVVREALKKAGA